MIQTCRQVIDEKKEKFKKYKSLFLPRFLSTKKKLFFFCVQLNRFSQISIKLTH